MGKIFNRNYYEIFFREKITRENLEKKYIPNIIKRMYLDEPKEYKSLILNIKRLKPSDLSDDVKTIILPLFQSMRRIGKDARFKVSDSENYKRLKDLGF